MIAVIKKHLYFPLAWYFRFFAQIKLRRWKPRIVVVTGSNGKTTLLHMLEAQFGDKARYSHHANSSFGIPFDILGLHRQSLFVMEWIGLFLRAPIYAFFPIYKQSIYIVEADADRPEEGKFLGEFLRPEVVLWVSTAKSHSMNFDALVKEKKFSTVEEAVAYEFGFFLEYCSKFAVINGDLPLEKKQKERTKAEVLEVKKHGFLEKYELEKNKTVFVIKGEKFSFDFIMPEVIYYSVVMSRKVVEYFDLEFDRTFSKFALPPGRSSIFRGIKGITIVDSCYNANFSSMSEILKMYDAIKSSRKWVVLGDMLEQGSSERGEHEKLAELIASYNFERVILMGPRVSKYTYPLLKQQEIRKKQKEIEKFLGPKETLDYLLENLQGEEAVLFKGARFMEGIIENLLLDKSDAAKLSRREEVWEKRRKQFGL